MGSNLVGWETPSSSEVQVVTLELGGPVGSPLVTLERWSSLEVRGRAGSWNLLEVRGHVGTRWNLVGLAG
jgi:hypothetical protein